MASWAELESTYRRSRRTVLYNKVLYDHDVAAYERAMDILRQAQAVYPNPIDLHLAKSVEVFDPDTGRECWHSSYKPS